jgi:ABC-type antimicrobial peptide transport system permease subunit
VVRIALRSSDNALVNGPALRKELAAVAPQSALFEMRTLTDAIDDENAFYRIFGALFSIFGVVALTLAAVGLYGVAAFWTSRRTREIGIRLALGARPREVLRLVFAEGGKQVGIGIALGTVVAMLAARMVRSVLFEVSSTDPITVLLVVGTLMLSAILACLPPAIRAMRVDPVIALRAE